MGHGYHYAAYVMLQAGHVDEAIDLLRMGRRLSKNRGGLAAMLAGACAKQARTALRQGRFFVSTGEVLLPEFTVGDKESGQTLKLAGDTKVEVTARLEWTFPPAFAEVCHGCRLAIQAQGNAFRRRVSAVAVQAPVRKNRTDVSIEFDSEIRGWTVSDAGNYCK